ncbi:hypothetical protein H0H81_006924 [Sphagnurus paluster]|uniref:Thioester reductase (TE) domain-containing protein n=1 Tax=Sphagnurus paluster TaxID=117069 RepID=A0A9P7FTH2_9AGAR|nr:hypothetical protein H0H81_006924 [Sphagnurus paluster]
MSSTTNKPAYDQLKHMETLVNTYSRLPPGQSSAQPNCAKTARVSTTSILLTGSTGNLGSDILALLLSDPSVTKVYALNRRSSKGSALERIKQQFKTKGFDETFLWSGKVVFITGDTARADLGLEAGLYEEIRQSITMIIHNAWPINLQRDLSYFEPNMQGLRNLIDLGHASRASQDLRFIFISSLSACQAWNSYRDTQFVPENVLTNTVVGCGFGYGASKHVAERIVSRSGLQATSIRVTQLCGRFSGDHWSPSEWIPIFISASIGMGILPIYYGVISCVPMDVAAQCIHEFVSSEKPLPPMLNLSHPRPFPWDVVVEGVNRTVVKNMGSKPLPTTSLANWMSLVKKSKHMAEIRHPVLKLVAGDLGELNTQSDSNKASVQVDTPDPEHIPGPGLSIELAQLYSPTLRDARQVSAEDVQRWVKEWFSTGFCRLPTSIANYAKL